MDLNLKGKNAIVTGASRGLGYAVALCLAREGANVLINSRNQNSIEQAAASIRKNTTSQVIPFAADITRRDAAEHIIAKAANAFGNPDILITNAGGPKPGKFMDFTDEEWENAVNLSFLSHVRLIRAAVPGLEKSKHGSVLTITSYSVKQPVPNLVLSNSIRAATVNLTKSLALELGDIGIRFNSILPGWTETERIEQLHQNRAEQNQTTLESEKQKQTAESPLGRMATPEEFAKTAVFMVSPAASYMTGVMLSLDGGMVKGVL